MAHGKEFLFSFVETVYDGLFRIFREAGFLDNVVVEMVSQELSARGTTMAIVNAEKGAFGPFFVFPVVRLDDVEDDTHSVFVVVPDQTLVSIGCVTSHHSVPLVGASGLLVVRDLDPRARLQRILPRFVIFDFLVHHLFCLSSRELLHLRHSCLVRYLLALRNLLVHLLLMHAQSCGVHWDACLSQVGVSCI